MRLLVWYPLRWLLLALPPRLGLAVLGWLGEAHYSASRGKRAQLASNLERLGLNLTPEQKERALREYLRTHYQSQLIIFLIPNLRPENIGEVLEFAGLAELEAARSQGRGVVLAHAHFGPVHLPLAALGLLGHPMKQIGYPTDQGLSFIGRQVAFRLRLRYEARIPAEIIKAGQDMRPVFRALKSGGVVMVTADGTGRSESFGKQITLPFFGQPVEFPLGPANLALKTKSLFLPMFIEPGEKKPFKITICPSPSLSEDCPDPALYLTKAFLELYAQRVARHPGLMHFLDRFEPGKLIVKL